MHSLNIQTNSPLKVKDASQIQAEFQKMKPEKKKRLRPSSAKPRQLKSKRSESQLISHKVSKHELAPYVKQMPVIQRIPSDWKGLNRNRVTQFHHVKG